MPLFHEDAVAVGYEDGDLMDLVAPTRNRRTCRHVDRRCMGLPLALVESLGEFANDSHHFCKSTNC